MTQLKKGIKLFTAINQKAKNMLQKKMALIWTALFLLSIGSLVTLYQLSAALHTDSRLDITAQEITTLGYQLQSASDYLTSEARSFAVTGAPSHLINYWNEVHIEKRREQAIKKLALINTSEDLSHFLVLSIHHSDALINTELRSMFLVLTAYNVPTKLFPPSVRAYQPTPSDIKLTVNEKILLAQKIMFDQKYVADKSSIINPIKEFNGKISTEVKNNIIKTNLEQNNLFLILNILLTVLTLVIVCIAWYRLVE